MAETTQILRKLGGRPRRVGRMEHRRSDPAAATAQRAESFARKLALAADGQQDFPADREARVRRWDELITGAEVSRLRYVAELTGIPAALSRVILP
jgi:hypothetical protein